MRKTRIVSLAGFAASLLALAASLALLYWAIRPEFAIAVDQVNDVGPKGAPHIFWINGGADVTFGPGAFDYDGNGTRDIEQVTAIGYKIGATNDSMAVFLERTPSGPYWLELPAGSLDAWSQRLRPITPVVGKADSAIIRYKNKNIGRTPLYVWGS